MNMNQQKETEPNCQILVNIDKQGHRLFQKTCKYCGTLFEGKHDKCYCGERCYTAYRNSEKYKLGVEGTHYIVCPICKQRTGQITPSHAKLHGFVSLQDMLEKLHLDKNQMVSDSKRAKHKGENNPAYQHNGKFSAWSKNFKNGYSSDWVQKQCLKTSIRMNSTETRKNNSFNLEYWIEKFPKDLEKAKLNYTLNQTRDLKYFVDKYGNDEGYLRYSYKIEKWSKNFKKCNFSKISQILFDIVYSKLDSTNEIYYATLERENMKDYKNKEYILKVENTYVRPDFICLQRKKIIEFDGSYWHSNKKANPIREKTRDAKIKLVGYQILHIAEKDFKENMDGEVEKCLNFLNS